MTNKEAQSTFRKIFGRRPVLEALRSSHAQVKKIVLARGSHGAVMDELLREAKARGVPVEWIERRQLEHAMKGSTVSALQGVMALLQSQDYTDVSDLIHGVQSQLPSALIVALDEMEDPRNVGAIARCAEGAGAQGLIITRHRSAEITLIAVKASGGALEHLAVAQVHNLADCLRDIKQAGLWVVGLDAKDGQTLWEADLNRPLALVVGSEAKGLRRLTREICDFLIKIPMLGHIASLNASVAAGIVLYEVQRQRLTRKNPQPTEESELS